MMPQNPGLTLTASHLIDYRIQPFTSAADFLRRCNGQRILRFTLGIPTKDQTWRVKESARAAFELAEPGGELVTRDCGTVADWIVDGNSTRFVRLPKIPYCKFDRLTVKSKALIFGDTHGERTFIKTFADRPIAYRVYQGAGTRLYAPASLLARNLHSDVLDSMAQPLPSEVVEWLGPVAKSFYTIDPARKA